jgi:hypothetical protein
MIHFAVAIVAVGSEYALPVRSDTEMIKERDLEVEST